MNNLRRAFVASSIAWAVLLPLAPFAASQPAPARAWYAIAFVVYGIGGFICHQLPARSFYSWSAQWPVCARCTGIYVGAAVTTMIAGLRGQSGFSSRVGSSSGSNVGSGVSRTISGERLVLVVGALPTALTLIYEWTTGSPPSNVIRAVAGVPLGAAVAFVLARSLSGAP